MRHALLLLALFAASARAADQASDAEPPRTGWGFAGLPLVNADSDKGVGYGLRGAAYDYGAGQKPYRYSIVLTYFATTGGQQKHSIKLDAPEFLGTPWRFDLKLFYQRELFATFYGVGNASVNDKKLTAIDERAKDEKKWILPCDRAEGAEQKALCNPSARYYTYDIIAPYLFLNARRNLSGPWKLFGGYKFRLASIVDHPERAPGLAVPSLLAEKKPLGWDCGSSARGLCRTAWLDAGVVYDTRDNEPAPTSGMFHELSLRGASKVLGSSFTYGGANLVLRFYQGLPSYKRLVFAGRLLVDALFGGVPFYEQGYFGGLTPDEAVGGSESVRGQLRWRYVGNVKTLANGEVRWVFLEVVPGGQKLDFTLQLGLDAGRVWSKLPGDKALDGTGLGLHYGLAGGLRIAWNDNFVIRVDYARSLPLEDPGLYITFDHVF